MNPSCSTPSCGTTPSGGEPKDVGSSKGYHYALEAEDLTCSPVHLATVVAPTVVETGLPKVQAQKPKPVVVLDSDETIGSWGDLSLLYSYFWTVLRKAPCPTRFVEIAKATGVVRPHLAELLTSLLSMKAEGDVGAIVLMTAAPNCYGWVSFLVRVLEVWLDLGKGALFDLVLAKEQILAWNKEKSIFWRPEEGIPKDMHQVKAGLGLAPDTPTLMVEDRPHLVLHADRLLQVPPYNVAVDLVGVAETFLDKEEWTETLALTWRVTFSETWDIFCRHPHHFTDTAADVALKSQVKTVKDTVKTLCT